jgi:hypothetical protein
VLDRLASSANPSGRSVADHSPTVCNQPRFVLLRACGRQFQPQETLDCGGTSNRVEFGQTFSYRITATSGGPAPSPSSSATDDVPAGPLPLDAPKGTIEGQRVTWPIGPPAVGGSITRLPQLRADSVPRCPARNVAVAHPSGGVGDDPDNDTSNPPVDTMIVRSTPLADLAVTKTAPATVRSGEQNLSERRVGIQPVRHSEVEAGEERSRMSLQVFPLSPAVEPEASAREVVHPPIQ